jgi:hypothetical protein
VLVGPQDAADIESFVRMQKRKGKVQNVKD